MQTKSVKYSTRCEVRLVSVGGGMNEERILVHFVAGEAVLKYLYSTGLYVGVLVRVLAKEKYN